MRLTFPKAKRLCGLDETFEIRSEEDYNFALRVWKDQTVVARQANDDDLAAELSQCKQLFKRRYSNRIARKCPRCGDSKSAYADHCQTCSITYRYYDHRLHTHSVTMKEHEIEEGLVIIGPRCHQTGVLTSIIRKVATTGQVGDSFVTDKPSTSIKNVARMQGMEVIVRIANPEEKDLKKRRYRVWRSDGLEMEQVNEVIRKRMAKEEVPPAKPCVPPLPGTLPERHRKKATAANPEQPNQGNGPRQKRPLSGQAAAAG